MALHKGFLLSVLNARMDVEVVTIRICTSIILTQRVNIRREEEVRDDVVAFSDTIRTQTYTAKLVRSLITYASALRVILPHVNIPLDDIACIGVLLGDG